MKIIEMSGIVGRDITPAYVRAQLINAKGAPIEAEISSPGGLIVPGIEIFNLIRQYKGKSTARIMGMAGSMASIIPLAFDKIESFSNSILFIHLAMTTLFDANRNDIRKRLDIVNGFDNILINELSNRTGKDKKEIEALMEAETFVFGENLKEFGFSDKIIDAKDGDETNQESIILNAKTEIYACQETIKQDDQQIDTMAALLTGFESALLPTAGTGTAPDVPAKPAALGAKPNKTEVKMTLDELLASDKDAEKEYQARLKEAKAEAAKPAELVVGEIKKPDFTKALNVIKSDTYGKKYKDLAAGVIEGSIDEKMFDIMISMYDSDLEELASAAAKDEQPGETPAGKGVELSVNGEISTTTDEAALIAKLSNGGK